MSACSWGATHERLQLGCNYFTVAETFKELGLRVSDIKDFALFMHDKLFTHTLGCLAKEWAAGEREIEFDAMVQQCSLDRFLDSFPYGKHMMDFLHAGNPTRLRLHTSTTIGRQTNKWRLQAVIHMPLTSQKIFRASHRVLEQKTPYLCRPYTVLMGVDDFV